MKRYRILQNIIMIFLIFTGCILQGFFPAAVSAVRAQEEPVFCENEEDLSAAFHTAQLNSAGNLQIRCSKELYDAILEEGSSLLDRTRFKNNILDYSCSYYTSGLFEFSDIVYGNILCAECETQEEVTDVFFSYTKMQDRPDYIIVFAEEELFSELLENGRIFILAFRGGVEKFDCTYNEHSRWIRAENMTCTEDTLISAAPVRNASDFKNVTDAYAAAGAEQFTVFFEEDYFRELMDDPSQTGLLLASSLLGRYSWGINGTGSYLAFGNVSWLEKPVPFAYAAAEAEFSDAVSEYADAEVEVFTIVFEKDFFKTLTDDPVRMKNMALSSRLDYYESSTNNDFCIIRYSNVQYSDAPDARLSTPEETAAFFRTLSPEADHKQVLYCTPELFELLLTDEEGSSMEDARLRRIDDIMEAYGVFSDSISYIAEKNIITLPDCSHSPGARIVYAVKNDAAGILSEREQMVMEEALQLVQDVKEEAYAYFGIPEDAKELPSDLPLLMARMLHDRLCRRIRYVIDEATTEDDNAIGAFLNGEANCDGYSDAFYLAGSLAGLTVSFQHGISRDDEEADWDDTGHMWNLLYLDGSWRMIDVTWDDSSNYEILYDWFNIDPEDAMRTHKWNRRISDELLHKPGIDE